MACLWLAKYTCGGGTELRKSEEDKMKMISGLAVILATIFVGAAFAGGDLSRADVQKFAMEMGTDDDGNM